MQTHVKFVVLTSLVLLVFESRARMLVIKRSSQPDFDPELFENGVLKPFVMDKDKIDLSELAELEDLAELNDAFLVIEQKGLKPIKFDADMFENGILKSYINSDVMQHSHKHHYKNFKNFKKVEIPSGTTWLDDVVGHQLEHRILHVYLMDQ